MIEIRTARLLLRPWRASDLAPWAAMNADPEVREHLGGPLTRAQSDDSVASFTADFAQRGYGWWAVEEQVTGDFIGFAGLDRVDEHLPFTGVEVGWRLARPAWGHGYATEAALATLTFAFESLALPEVLAITTVDNLRSQAVMRRIGMTRDPAGDFDDHSTADGTPTRNVLHRISDPRT
ncbi:GNAT family N-acetyltransferase [Aeromicrobium duanguangcaii]|uniref:GNAT family N-acetyltransferase n=1 Tax=Aeromicrobium duanguangcaii TaxID=2968086 RepID=A0ABY5KHK1_9ACTN|nr:GNAT family N-acetyltransferase [Aeromicrobium duanguangcaii]MCD9152960.1 GNAT family N-acetyltransferase [Aeromicrobium duanguangcaii]UUI69934.1 GNAT family N-acetyltransferase [Aeromicrobium duanguangcaii]